MEGSANDSDFSGGGHTGSEVIARSRIVADEFCLLFPRVSLAHEDIGGACVFSASGVVQRRPNNDGVLVNSDRNSETVALRRILGNDFGLLCPPVTLTSEDVHSAGEPDVGMGVTGSSDDNCISLNRNNLSKAVRSRTVFRDNLRLLFPRISVFNEYVHGTGIGTGVIVLRNPDDSGRVINVYSPAENVARCRVLGEKFRLLFPLLCSTFEYISCAAVCRNTALVSRRRGTHDGIGGVSTSRGTCNGDREAEGGLPRILFVTVAANKFGGLFPLVARPGINLCEAVRV